ncbi:hypothetical protein [Epilithonimonas lactis]|uniref:hypothetical protein n=1 Tax=Epilithonimonas lactis TaxID=421072 RepID=UPI00068C8792|nr:hypothetical protein [Epilithonimonas lactis]SEQ20986.1 hypothetical protein SAMN04488097_1675 [Epilithonimonas lactis]
MNNLLPFQLGEHYENWEFDLEILEIERIRGYDSYLYFKEIQIFDNKAYYIELIFLFDILEFVLLMFSFSSKEELIEFTSKIKNQYTDLYCRENGLYAELYYGKLKDKAHF